MNPLDIEDRETRKVEIKGGHVFVRTISAGEQIDLAAEEESAGDDVRKLLIAQMLAYVCDESGEPALTQETALTFVNKRRPASIKSIIEQALDLNGIGPKSAEAIQGN